MRLTIKPTFRSLNNQQQVLTSLLKHSRKKRKKHNKPSPQVTSEYTKNNSWSNFLNYDPLNFTDHQKYRLPRHNSFLDNYLNKNSEITIQLRNSFDKYLQEIENITNRTIPSNQRNLLQKYILTNRFSKISKEQNVNARRKFREIKSESIKNWEKYTNQKWPKYKKNILSKHGEIIRIKGANYDAHHIVELSYGGTPDWWNLHPAAFPNEHQHGIHKKGSIADNLFGSE